MLQTPTNKLINSPPTQTQELHSLPSSLKQCCKVSRRGLAIGTNSLFLSLVGFQALVPLKTSIAKAEEFSEQEYGNQNELLQNGSDSTITPSVEQLENGSDSTTSGASVETLENGSDSTNSADICGDKRVTKKAFLDISIDGKPVGRIVVGLYGNDAPIGAARFSNLVSGRAGISYRRKEFVKILPNYVQHGGVRSYGVDAELAQRSGGGALEAENLVDEWERADRKCPGTKNLAGTLSLVVRDPSRPPPKTKLVARDGRLQIDLEEVGTGPNGTEFVISMKDSPELDASCLVVGRVLEGTEVVERIGKVETVNENTSSPYFR